MSSKNIHELGKEIGDLVGSASNLITVLQTVVSFKKRWNLTQDRVSAERPKKEYRGDLVDLLGHVFTKKTNVMNLLTGPAFLRGLLSGLFGDPFLATYQKTVEAKLNRDPEELKSAIEELLSDSFPEASVTFGKLLCDEEKLNGIKLELEAFVRTSVRGGR